MARIGTRLLGCVSLLIATSARAQLPDTDLLVHADAGGEIVSHQLMGARIGSADSDSAVTHPDGSSWSAVSHALAGGGGNTLDDPPVADASVDVTVNQSGDTSVHGFGSASAHYYFYARVVATQPPPLVFNPPVMIRVTFHGETTIEGNPQFASGESSQAVSYFTVRDEIGAQDLIAESAASLQSQLLDDFGGTRVLTIPPGAIGDPLAVYVRADVTLHVRGSGTAHAHALSDPVFEFDQAAFDEYAALAGFEPFALDEYYGFEFSPAFAPEPDGVALGLAALGALAALSAGSRRR